MTRAERFQLFLNTLAASSVTSSHEEAFALIGSTLNDIEDRYSGVPYDPEQWQFDGRMYPPAPQFARAIGSRIIEYRSVAHSTFISETGAFAIIRRRGKVVEVAKPGADGDLIPSEVWA